MRITKRLPEEAYAFTEVVFENLEEYQKEYGNFIKAHYEMKQREEKFKANLWKKEEPFVS